MKTAIYITLFVFSLNLLADSYKIPFEWEVKQAPKAKVKKVIIKSNEKRALASGDDTEKSEIRFWKYDKKVDAPDLEDVVETQE